MQATVNVFPNKNHETNLFFFPLYERVGKKFWLWLVCALKVNRHILNSHLLSQRAQTHFASSSPSWVYIYTTKSNAVSKKRDMMVFFFTFTRNLMFEKGFRIRISRGPTTRKKQKKSQNLQLEEIWAVWEQGEAQDTLSTPPGMKRLCPALLKTDPGPPTSEFQDSILKDLLPLSDEAGEAGWGGTFCGTAASKSPV